MNTRKEKKQFYYYKLLLYDKNFHLKEIGNPIKSPNDPMGQFMGIFFIPKKKIKRTFELINLNKKNKKMHTTNFPIIDAKNNEKIYNIPLYSNWYEFDDYQDKRRNKTEKS